jgi:monothiol glutaredoxin
MYQSGELAHTLGIDAPAHADETPAPGSDQAPLTIENRL